MIHKAVEILAEELNAYLCRKKELPSSASIAVPTPIADFKGQLLLQQGAVGVSLVNLEEERLLNRTAPVYRDSDAGRVAQQPPLSLYLHLLFTSQFDVYTEALKHLSHTLRFFQSHGAFTRETTPGMDPGIESLSLELVSLDYERLNHLWGVLGGCYLPSALYKVRAVRLEEDRILGKREPVKIVDIEAGGLE